jgi:DNA-binding transcriptional ArsR family regulator
MKSIMDGTASIIMHPVRFSILLFIKNAKKPQYVEQIAKAVNEHPRLVSHHLNVLQDLGLVDCSYEVATAKGSSKRGVAVRLCKATPKLTKVLEEIAEDANAVARVEKK